MRTSVDCSEVREILEEHYPDRVYSVEDALVWVSGMNSGCKRTAESMARTLEQHDIPVGLVHDDGIHAMNNGGVQFAYGESA